MSEKLKQICAFIIKERKNSGENISNLILQKLLYFVQAGSLIYLGEVAFEDEIEAWQYGPVVPEAYREFKYNSIGLENIDIKNEFKDSNLAELIRNILVALKDKGPFDLVDLTHSYDSWLNAWNSGELVITPEKIKGCHEKLKKIQNGYIF